jgi:nucleotide-binding universal stress UspA family protein
MLMPNERAVVVGIDGSESAVHAAVWAGAEASRRSLPLRLVAVYFVPHTGMSGIVGSLGQIREGMAKQARDRLEEARAAVLAVFPGLTVRVAAREWNSVAALLHESERAKLLVLGCRGLGGFTGLLIGSTAVSLAVHAHCPVVVVRGPVREPEVAASVVVGVDGSAASDDAVAFACEEASLRGTGVTVVHAWNEMLTGTVPPELLDADSAETERDEIKALADYLSGWTEKYPDVPFSFVVKRGSPSKVLLSQTKHAQLIVVGSRGRDGFTGMLLGSTSQALVVHSSCPVAVIRPQSERNGTT